MVADQRFDLVTQGSQGEDEIEDADALSGIGRKRADITRVEDVSARRRHWLSRFQGGPVESRVLALSKLKDRRSVRVGQVYIRSRLRPKTANSRPVFKAQRGAEPE